MAHLRSVFTRHPVQWLLGCLFSVVSLTATAEVSVVDDLGNRVTLKQPAQRVVALAPHLVEMVYAVGAGDTLVGAVSYSNYPEAAKAIPRVGTYKDFSTESVLRSRPDLVLAWDYDGSRGPVEQLKQLGIPVYVTQPSRLEHIGESMDKIGKLLAAIDGERASQDFSAKLHQLREQYQQRQPVTVFYQVWNNPLQTLNGEHVISDVIELCGGRNVFADANPVAPKVNVEAVLRVNPQVIVASGMGEARPEWLDDWLQWPSIQAVAQQQRYFVPPDIIQRHTPRVLLGAEMLCQPLEKARQHYAK